MEKAKDGRENDESRISMKLVITEDKRGYLHRYYITDDMKEKDAEKGIPDDPIDVEQLDWDEIKRELHNLLVKRAIINIKDVPTMRHLSNTILSVLQPRLVGLYKLKNAELNKFGGKK